MTKQITIVHSPYIALPRKTKEAKKIAINLNTYRNLHFLVNNQCKKIAKDNIEKYLKDTGQFGIMFTNPVDVTFKFYKGSNRRLDKSNVYAVATKYFYDALVELGILQDDNDDYIKNEVMLETEYDKENSRIELTLTERTQ